MEYRINKEWTPHAMITAVAMNIAVSTDGTNESRSGRVHRPGRLRGKTRKKLRGKHRAGAVKTWLTESLQTKRPHTKTNENATSNGTRPSKLALRIRKKKETVTDDRS